MQLKLLILKAPTQFNQVTTTTTTTFLSAPLLQVGGFLFDELEAHLDSSRVRAIPRVFFVPSTYMREQ
jgi:hypothetical protein